MVLAFLWRSGGILYYSHLLLQVFGKIFVRFGNLFKETTFSTILYCWFVLHLFQPWLSLPFPVYPLRGCLLLFSRSLWVQHEITNIRSLQLSHVETKCYKLPTYDQLPWVQQIFGMLCSHAIQGIFKTYSMISLMTEFPSILCGVTWHPCVCVLSYSAAVYSAFIFCGV